MSDDMMKSEPIYFLSMSKKLNAIIPDETWQALEEIAKKEQRTKSQMAAILLGEALANRQQQQQKTS
jgi:predicted transcriptional regulator